MEVFVYYLTRGFMQFVVILLIPLLLLGAAALLVWVLILVGGMVGLLSLFKYGRGGWKRVPRRPPPTHRLDRKKHRGQTPSVPATPYRSFIRQKSVGAHTRTKTSRRRQLERTR